MPLDLLNVPPAGVKTPYLQLTRSVWGSPKPIKHGLSPGLGDYLSSSGWALTTGSHLAGGALKLFVRSDLHPEQCRPGNSSQTIKEVIQLLDQLKLTAFLLRKEKERTLYVSRRGNTRTWPAGRRSPNGGRQPPVWHGLLCITASQTSHAHFLGTCLFLKSSHLEPSKSYQPAEASLCSNQVTFFGDLLVLPFSFSTL